MPLPSSLISLKIDHVASSYMKCQRLDDSDESSCTFYKKAIESSMDYVKSATYIIISGSESDPNVSPLLVPPITRKTAVMQRIRTQI